MGPKPQNVSPNETDWQWKIHAKNSIQKATLRQQTRAKRHRVIISSVFTSAPCHSSSTLTFLAPETSAISALRKQYLPHSFMFCTRCTQTTCSRVKKLSSSNLVHNKQAWKGGGHARVKPSGGSESCVDIVTCWPLRENECLLFLANTVDFLPAFPCIQASWNSARSCIVRVFGMGLCTGCGSFPGAVSMRSY